ncbi:MAG: hypothetical protein ACHQK8_07240 [Bacteroidia bacterium]
MKTGSRNIALSIREYINSVPLYRVIIALLFYLPAFVDSLTGFLLHISDYKSISTIDLSPSILLRLIIMFLSFFYLKKGFQTHFMFAIMLFILSVEFIGYLAIHHNITGLFIGLNWSIKVLYAISVGLFLYNMIRSEKITYNELVLLFRTAVILYSLSIFIPFIFGGGIPTYGKESLTFGRIGYLANGNGAGALQGIGSIISFHIYRSNKNFKNLILYLLNLVTCYIVATKGTLVFCTINLILIFYYSRLSIKLISICLVIILLTQIPDNMTQVLFKSYDVVKFRYDRSANFLLFLWSGRDAYFTDAINSFNIDGFAFIRILCGFGAFVAFRNTGYGFEDTHTRYFLEAEMFDMFFMYGLIGLISYFLFFGSGIMLAIKRRRFFLIIPLILCWFYSAFAGHMLFNGMSILGVMVLYILIIMPMNEYDIFKKKKKEIAGDG